MPAKRIRANGLEFHVIDEGAGPGVLLLHGFPDSSYLWRNQIPALAAAGFRAIAPDLRGFGESDKPEGIDAYRLNNVIADLIGILDAVGVERAHVVGHDWGAVSAWLMASLAPERVERLVVMSVGHPAGFARPPIHQLRKSWYMFAFQFTGLAEEALRRDDWRLLKEWSDGTGDAGRWMHDLARPGALTAALNWYRANTPPEILLLADPFAFPKVEASTLGIWGENDFALGEELMIASGDQVVGGWRYERVDRAGHWMPIEQPDRINSLLIGFLQAKE